MGCSACCAFIGVYWVSGLVMGMVGLNPPFPFGMCVQILIAGIVWHSVKDRFQ